MTALASGEATAMLEACTKRHRTPSGCPRDLAAATAGRPGPGMSDSGTFQTFAMWARAAGSVILR